MPLRWRRWADAFDRWCNPWHELTSTKGGINSIDAIETGQFQTSQFTPLSWTAQQRQSHLMGLESLLVLFCYLLFELVESFNELLIASVQGLPFKFFEC